jgi:hypothetical protein
MSDSAQPPPTDGQDDPRVPRTWEKVVCVIPLFLIFIPMTILTQHAIHAAEQTFKEMDLGRLPLLTEFMFVLDRLYLFHPVTVATAFLLQVFLHMTWAGKTYRRMFWFDFGVLLALTLLFWTYAWGMLAPLVALVENIR